MSQEKEWFEGWTDEQAKAERGILRNAIAILGAVCLVVLLTIAATWPTKANAQEIPLHVIEHHDGVKLQLLGGPCMDPTSNVVIATAPPQFQRGWKALTSQWRTPDGTWQPFAGCWLVIPKEVAGAPDDVFVLVFSDGHIQQILRGDLLKKATRA